MMGDDYSRALRMRGQAQDYRARARIDWRIPLQAGRSPNDDYSRHLQETYTSETRAERLENSYRKQVRDLEWKRQAERRQAGGGGRLARFIDEKYDALLNKARRVYKSETAAKIDATIPLGIKRTP